MMEKVDKIDRRILRMLQKDGTLSMDALADSVGLSRNACWRRVRHMEDTGVIHKRVALVDATKLDCALTAFVMVRTSTHTRVVGKFQTCNCQLSTNHGGLPNDG